MSSCPDSEILAAYLDGRLFPEERERLEQHFARCRDCCSVLAGAIRFETEEQVAVEPGPRRWQRPAAAAAMLLTVLGTTSWLTHRALDRSEPHGEPIAATAVYRPLVPRLAGQDEWAPAPDAGGRRRSGSALPTRGSWRALEQLERAQAAADAAPSGERLASLGNALLRAGAIEEALATLERSLAAEPDAAAARNDLAAAFLARGLANHDGYDLAIAVEQLTRALAVDPSLPAAVFNRALALDALHLDAAADGAWARYLELDATSPWASEAQRRRRAPRSSAAPVAATLRAEIAATTAAGDAERIEQLVAAHRQQARETFSLELLPAWAEAQLAGDREGASYRLERARALATIWQAQTGDGSLLRWLDEIARLDGREHARFAGGVLELREGMLALEEADIDAAAASFERAAAAIPAGSLLGAWSELLLSVCAYYREGALPELAQRLAALADRERDDPAFAAKVAWLRGLLHSRRGDPEALELYRSALATFEQLGEAEHTAWLHYLVGEAYALVGDLSKAWKHRRMALAFAPTLADRNRSFGILIGTAFFSVWLEDRPAVAEAALAELARGNWTPEQRCELHLARARVRVAYRDLAGARADLHQANAWLWQVRGPLRRHLTPEVQTLAGMTAETPAAAIAALTRAIDRFRAEAPARLPSLLLDRAQARRQLGDRSGAISDLQAGIDVLLRGQAGSHLDRLWQERLSRADQLFDALLALQADRSEAERAFVLAERGRARSLAAALQLPTAASASGATPASISSWRERIDPGTAIVSFAVLPNRILAWRLDRSSFRLVPVTAEPKDVLDDTALVTNDLAAGAWTRRTREASRRLYGALLAPAQLGPAITHLVLVPDKTLHGLPFAALVNPATGRFLIEERALSAAPSAAIHLAARRRDRALHPAGAARSALLIGDPAFDRNEHELDPLPAAAEEARRAALLYQRRELLLGERATRAEFLARAGEHEVVHFAGHALANPVDPSRSSLILAASASRGSSTLPASEVATSRFPRTHIVVLAGCDTARGPMATREGTLSLTRAFLAAEVPSVVASLWPVSDERTVPLMVALHRRLSQGDSAADALRAAQLSALRSEPESDRSPATWAAFQAFGS